MKSTLRRAAGILVALWCSSAAADPGYYVVTAYDDPGRRIVDFRYWTVESRGSPTVVWPEIGLGWNPTGRWFTEVLASYEGSFSDGQELSTLNWQNDVLLTQGQYPFDLAIHTLLVRPLEGIAAYAIEVGPAFQTEIWRTQLNFNLVFDRTFGATPRQTTQLKYQWQVRQRWKPWLHFGAQGFGELGTWNHWSRSGEQSHRLGPALFGRVPVGEHAIEWQAAYLTGSTYAQRGNMLTVRVIYEF